MRTAMLPPCSATVPSSLSSTTCSSRASSTGPEAHREVGPEPGEVGGAGEHDALLALLDEGSSSAVLMRAHEVAQAPASSRSGTAASSRPPRRGCDRTVARLSSVRSVDEGALVVVAEQVGADVDDPLLDPAGGGDEHDAAAASPPIGTSSTWRTVERASDGYCTTATWRVSWASSRTVRSTTSSRSTAPSRNVRDGALLGGAHRLDGREPVDEQAVALVGGHPPGAGVRLRRSAPPPRARPCRCGRSRARRRGWCRSTQRLGADRLVGRDVVLDDGAQHGSRRSSLIMRSPPGRLDGRRRAGAGTLALGVPILRAGSRRARMPVTAPRRRVASPP